MKEKLFRMRNILACLCSGSGIGLSSVNSNSQTWLVGVAVFLVVYFVVKILPSEHSNYKRVVEIANRTSGSVTRMKADARAVLESTNDPDLKFVAGYFATVASLYSNGGATNISTFRSESAWKGILTGGLNTLLRPRHFLSALNERAWLWSNEGKFQSAARAIEKRYGGLNTTPLLVAAVAGGISVPLLVGYRRMRERNG